MLLHEPHGKINLSFGATIRTGAPTPQPYHRDVFPIVDQLWVVTQKFGLALFSAVAASGTSVQANCNGGLDPKSQ